MADGEEPEKDAGCNRICGAAPQGVLDGERYAQVALYANSREEEGAVVDGHVEDEARERAKGVGHIPDHVVHHLLHLEGQEEEEEEIRNGQVEKQDVDRPGLLPHFLAESVEGQNVRWEAQHKGDDVDRETQHSVALLHVGLRVSRPR